jgi:hypothetical protein
VSHIFFSVDSGATWTGYPAGTTLGTSGYLDVLGTFEVIELLYVGNAQFQLTQILDEHSWVTGF